MGLPIAEAQDLYFVQDNKEADCCQRFLLLRSCNNATRRGKGCGTQGETGDAVELLELPDGAILKCLGYGRKGSKPRRVTGCAANQGRSAGLDGTSTARYLPAKAQRPEQSYSGKSTTPPYFPAICPRR